MTIVNCVFQNVLSMVFTDSIDTSCVNVFVVLILTPSAPKVHTSNSLKSLWKQNASVVQVQACCTLWAPPQSSQQDLVIVRHLNAWMDNWGHYFVFFWKCEGGWLVNGVMSVFTCAHAWWQRNNTKTSEPLEPLGLKIQITAKGFTNDHLLQWNLQMLNPSSIN